MTSRKMTKIEILGLLYQQVARRHRRNRQDFTVSKKNFLSGKLKEFFENPIQKIAITIADCFFKRQMSLTLMKITSQGIAHHDIKPQNILVEEVKLFDGKIAHRFILIDFGISLTSGSIVDGESTMSGNGIQNVLYH